MINIIDDFKYRDLHKDDYHKGVVELLSQLTSIDKSKISKHSFAEFVENLEQDGHRFTKVIENDDKIIACASIVIEPKLIHNLSYVGHIEDVVVDRECRGLGLGKFIIDYLIKLAESKRCYKVILDCDTKNVGFYHKCGFEQKGTQMAKYF